MKNAPERNIAIQEIIDLEKINDQQANSSQDAQDTKPQLQLPVFEKKDVHESKYAHYNRYQGNCDGCSCIKVNSGINRVLRPVAGIKRKAKGDGIK